MYSTSLLRHSQFYFRCTRKQLLYSCGGKMIKDNLIKNLKYSNLRFASDLRFAGQHNSCQRPTNPNVGLSFFSHCNQNMCDDPKFLSFSPAENSKLMNTLGLYLLSAVSSQHWIKESFIYLLHLHFKCRKYMKSRYVGMFVSFCLPTWSPVVALWSK